MRALYICGSHNQTTQLHAVAKALPEFEAAFSPFYGDWALSLLRRTGILDATIMGRPAWDRCERYLRQEGLTLDRMGQAGPYDLVVTCTDLVVPRALRDKPVVVVQEGMTDPENLLSRFIQKTRLLPLWVTSTTLTGLSGNYDRLCVASRGYRDLFVERGAPADRLVITGIPNFDNCERYRDNDIPHHGYLLLCTTDMRETFRWENRPKFLRQVRALADGRQIIIKLHPNERGDRARREIAEHCPGALVQQEGSAEQLVANCDILVTQYSSLAYVGLALDKEVHSWFDMDELRRLCPIQNGGTSAQRIAEVCREVTGASLTPSLAQRPKPAASLQVQAKHLVDATVGGLSCAS